MSLPNLTRRQQEIYEYLVENLDSFPHPPTLDELCEALGLSSRGSLHKQLQALIQEGLIEPMNNQRRGVRLAQLPGENSVADDNALPLYGRIAAGQPIEAIASHETISVPPSLRTDNPCYVLEVKGDSMIEEGILDGDWVVIEKRDTARNGEIVVALVDGEEATLKRIEQQQGKVTLHPANASMQPMIYLPEQVQIQGVLVGQMRSYH
ncbi:transcriptional repressor LexA [Thiolapillus brandeum]|uniref:LexA repressor n=1 Tax=Thiolapillus brandeum TaxID=1076588 RepID=A0A7U6GJ07_9GAMM|nr:transcriptional repressor LexA [Thiolapillus brandeum]BAO44516.1 repressor LexA [Thiolapillus brandeum]